MVRASDSGARGRGIDPHSGRRVVSLSKTHVLPKSTGNTQEAVAPWSSLKYLSIFKPA